MDRAEALGVVLLLGLFAGTYLLVAVLFALWAIVVSSRAPVDPWVVVVTALTGVGLFAARPPQRQDAERAALRNLVAVLLGMGWGLFVVLMGRALGVTVAFVGVTALAFALMLVLFRLFTRRVWRQDDLRNAAIAAANRAEIVRHWAQEAEQLPELRGMLREAGWQPDAPGARESYLRVWDEYRARRRRQGLPAWPRATDNDHE